MIILHEHMWDCDGLELKLISPIIRIQFWLKLDRKKVITPKKLARFLYIISSDKWTKGDGNFFLAEKDSQPHTQNQIQTNFMSLRLETSQSSNEINHVEIGYPYA